MSKKDLIPHDLLLLLLEYRPLTGQFLQRVRTSHRVKVGDVAGALHKALGYRVIHVLGKTYLEHRLAWFYVHGEWPILEIDHINGNRSDNRLANLRDVSHSENMRNITKISSANTSGFTGVYWNKIGKNWQAKTCVGDKQIHLGFFDDPKQASAVRDAYVKNFVC